MKNPQYAHSLKTERVKEKDFPYNGETITCTNELLSFVRKLQDSDIEKMLILYLDAQNKLTCMQVITGTVNQAVVFPREVIKHAILSGACAIIMVHNHPSGYIKPSDSDIRMTNIIKDVCKPLDILIHDHIIIGGTDYFSFREEGIIF